MRILRQILILGFLIVTFSAFLLTMFRFYPPIPRSILLFSYGMMAPYQGYERYNADLRAEGQDSSGAWHAINLDPYFPVIRGEEHIRKYYMIFTDKDPVAITTASTTVATKLLQLEKEKGKDVRAVRLYWDQWLPSPLGYEALRTASGSFRDLLTTVHD